MGYTQFIMVDVVMFMCILLVYVNSYGCVFLVPRYSQVLQFYVCNSSERQGIHKVGMYD